jgi:hypothetical protein
MNPSRKRNKEKGKRESSVSIKTLVYIFEFQENLLEWLVVELAFLSFSCKKKKKKTLFS